MKAGDLVVHKRTRAMGMIIRVPRGRNYVDVSYDIYFDVEWYDGCSNAAGSHLIGELIPVNESR